LTGKRWTALAAAMLIALFAWPNALAQDSAAYRIDLGLRTETCNFSPLIAENGANYIALDVLSRLDTYEEMPVVTGPVAEEAEIEEAAIAEEAEDEDSEEGEAVTITRRPPEPALTLPREFILAGEKYALRKSGDERIHLFNAQASQLGSPVIVRGGRIYLPADALFELGIALTYAPETGNIRLIGVLRDVRFDKSEETLRISTLLPATAFAEGLENGFRVVFNGVFVKENAERELGDASGTTLITRNLPHHRMELVFRQETLSGYKLYTEPEPASFFRVHLGNHFDLVSYARTSSGEISLNVGFTRPTEAKTTLLQAPSRLVLDFEGAIYDEATRYVDVNVGGVRQIRVGQFQQTPPVVRVVVEMTRALRYRVLRQGQGERYFVQLYRGDRRSTVIMLDAGHGGSDPGAIGITGVREKDIALEVTTKLAKALRTRGYEVMLTRDDDRFVSLGQRADLCNEALPMIFVSLHANWIDDPTFTGVMTFHFDGASQAQVLAHTVQRNLLASTGAVNREVRTANFFVLRETVVPAVLVEVGFLTNTQEEYKLRDPLYQKRIVDGLAQGIGEYMHTFGGF
jgi:N-acetylmuramoyl-L-alanine amidase